MAAGTALGEPEIQLKIGQQQWKVKVENCPKALRGSGAAKGSLQFLLPRARGEQSFVPLWDLEQPWQLCPFIQASSEQ